MRALWLTPMALLLAFACSAPDAEQPSATALPALIAVPEVRLDAMEPAVRRQLGEERARLDALLSKAEPVAADLSLVFGDLGRYYQVYDLPAAAIACYRNAHALQPETSGWPYLLGYLLYLEGDLGEAAAAFDAALRLEPTDAPANLWAGRTALARGRSAAAGAFFSQALAAAPSCSAARFGLGETARERGDHEAAIEHYRSVLAQYPEASSTHYPLAQALRKAGRAEEAERQFRLASENGTGAGGWAPCADPRIAEVSSLAVGSAAAVLRGSEASLGGSLEDEIAAYRRAVEQRGDDPVARRALGSALFEAGDAEGALEQLEKALELGDDASQTGDPSARGDPSLHYDLGLVLSKVGDLARAEQHLLRAVELHPEYLDAHLLLGTLYQRHRLFEPALEHYDLVLARDPDLTSARVQRALALAEVDRRAEALADLRRLAGEASPSDPQQKLNLATALAMIGDVDLAQGLLRQLIAEEGAPARLRGRAHFNLGMLAMKLGSPGEAIPHFRAAGELVPGFEQARKALEEARRRVTSIS